MTGRDDIFQKAMNEGHSAAWDQMWEQAVEAYQRALNEFPDNPKALTSLGLALIQLQRFEEAMQAYQQAARVMPDDPLPLSQVAQLSERVGNLKQAIQSAMQAAELYVKNREIDKALECWLRITQLDPENVTAHSRLAMVHERLGHTRQAVDEYLAVASLLQHGRDLEKAAEMIGRALKLIPDYPEARKAQSALKAGHLLPKPVRAKGGTGPLRMAQVRQMEKPRPIESDLDPIAEARQKALMGLAEVLFDYSESGGGSQASKRGMQDFVRGTGSLPLQKNERAKIMHHLSQAIDAQSKNNEAQAAEELEKALDAGFSHPSLHFNLGLLRVKGNRLESALRHLQNAVKHEDYAFAARLMMGSIMRQMERLPEAVSEYMEALKQADAAVVPPEKANEMRQLYEPLIEAQSSQQDRKVLEQLCDNIRELLQRPDWREQVAQAREQLPKTAEGAPMLPLAELLIQTQSGQVIGAISRAHELARAGRLRSAMEEAFDSLKYAPFYLPLHVLIGDLLIKEGRTQDAITKFSVVAQSYNARGESAAATNMLRRIIQLAPMDLKARTSLIEQLTARGQVDEAITEYMDLADAYYRLAELDMARKTFATALRLTQQSSAHRNWTLRILRRMADIDMQRLDWRQALRIFEQIRTLQPDDIPIRINLVDLNIRLNQANQAAAELENYAAYLEGSGRRADIIPFLEELVNEHPGQLSLRRCLAEEYYRGGRVQEAITLLDALGDTLLNAGDRSGAAEAIRAVIAMKPPNVEAYKRLLGQLQSEV